VLSRLQKFFEERVSPDDKGQGAETSDAQRLRVATCALLLEAAHADDDFSEDERATIAKLVGERFSLDATEAKELLAIAEAEREAASDTYGFTRLINETFNGARKLAVLELLWRVVYSDGLLEAHEDALMHRCGRMLGVRHDELMALKLKVKNGMD